MSYETKVLLYLTIVLIKSAIPINPLRNKATQKSGFFQNDNFMIFFIK